MNTTDDTYTRGLQPEDRRRIIDLYEERIAKARTRLIELRETCKPHHYRLNETNTDVYCIGCKERHFYYPGNEFIEGYDSIEKAPLPTIEKAPTT